MNPQETLFEKNVVFFFSILMHKDLHVWLSISFTQVNPIKKMHMPLCINLYMKYS